jgi:protein-L-isoaspartate(D-aspartate) O-methyltransferase
MDDPLFREHRARMVNEQLRARGVRDPRVLQAMSEVPRHLFVPEALRGRAYDDEPLPIGLRQTISQPYMVALMLEAMELTGSERVLEVGTGSGYQAALLGELAREVWSVEIIPELADGARRLMADLGYSNVHAVVADGSIGLPAHAPYDAIVVAAGAPEVPAALVRQLAQGGRLLVPVGGSDHQMLQRIRRDGAATTTEALLSCAFVPLVGAQGWGPGGTA